MSKVTGKELEKLIEGALNERGYNAKDLNKRFATTLSAADVESGSDTGLGSVKIKDFFGDKGISKAEPEENKLSVDDLQHYIDKPKEIDTKIQSQLIAIKKQGSKEWHETRIKRAQEVVKQKTLASADEPIQKSKYQLTKAENKLAKAEEAYKKFNIDAAGLTELSQLADRALKALDNAVDVNAAEQQSVSAPSVKSAKGDRGIFTKDQVAVVDRLLKGMGSIEARVTEVSRISKQFFDAVIDTNQLAKLQPSRLLSEIMLIDIFNSMAKEFDSGSGAYLFEHFLAMIVGGKTTGKEKTEYGKMGIVDFKMGNELGSAKFYQKPKTATQAVSGYVSLFKQNGGEEPVSVTYVIAAKKQDEEQVGNPARGTSDPARIIGAEIYTPKVEFDGQSFTINGFPAGDINQSDIKFTGNMLGPPVGTIYITTTRTSTFKKMLETGIAKQKEGVQALFESFKEYFKQLEEASSNAKTYIASGKTDDGTETYKSLSSAEKSFTGIVSGLEYGHAPEDLKQPKPENKITKEHVLKLIEESFNK